MALSPLPSSRMERKITIVSWNVNSVRSVERAHVIPSLVNDLTAAGTNLDYAILLLQDTRCAQPLSLVGQGQCLAGCNYYCDKDANADNAHEKVAIIVGRALINFAVRVDVHPSKRAISVFLRGSGRGLLVHSVYIDHHWRRRAGLARVEYNSIVRYIVDSHLVAQRNGDISIVGGDLNTHPHELAASPAVELSDAGFLNSRALCLHPPPFK